MPRDNHAGETLALLVGGGPAPYQRRDRFATIEAIKSGLQVLGIDDGYRWLVKGDTTHVTELTLDEVSQIHFGGGSMLRTSRTNPAADSASLERAIRALMLLDVRASCCRAFLC